MTATVTAPSTTEVTNKVKDLILKMLRLQESSNPHEAANAAAFVREMRSKYNVDPSNLKEESSCNLNVVNWEIFGGKRVNVAEKILLVHVTNFFNGTVILNKGYRSTTFDVFATEGNRIRIEIYFDYLVELMNKLADEAKKANPYSGRSFRTDFCKGFAMAISTRLQAMKSQDETNGVADSTALVVLSRNKRERQAVEIEVAKKYEKLKASAEVTVRVKGGYSSGKLAGGSVGLNQQMAASRNRMLTGG